MPSRHCAAPCTWTADSTPCGRVSRPCSSRASVRCPSLPRSRLPRPACRSICRRKAGSCPCTRSNKPPASRTPRLSWSPATCSMRASRPKARVQAAAAPSRQPRKPRCRHWACMSDQPTAAFRAGFAALVGRPNVGKSTLLNALVGEKVSIVTSRPQTTRHRVLGVLNRPGVQLAFVDTPGLHLGERRALNRAMNRTAAAALADADLVVFVVEALRFGEEDEAVLRRIKDSGRDAIAVINKVDKIPQKDQLLPFTAELAARHAFLDIVPVSAEKGSNIERLIDVIAGRLPESPELFPPDQRTDRSVEFQIAETIREKLTMELVEEVPYGIAVEIEKQEVVDEQLIAHAVVYVDRAGQKPIVIGAKGSRLKRIGQKAREELNTRLGRRLHLNLWVKVREDWADDARALAQLGLE